MSKALLRFIRLSPTKARLVAREVQGMNAELAIASLEFTPNKAAKVILKVIASAVANGGYDAQDVVVVSCRVDAGPVLRRFTPRARGRATPIRKPTSHIFVEVGTQKLQPKIKADSKAKVDSQKQEKKPTKTKTPKATEHKDSIKAEVGKSTEKVEKKVSATDSKVQAEKKVSKPKSTQKTTKAKADSKDLETSKTSTKKKTKGEE